MRLGGAWHRDPGAQAVCALLAAAGHQVYFVGGCVRNDLLGVAVADVDLCTDARPESVLVLAEAAGIRAVPTGIDHGTVTLVRDGTGYEVTSLRRDIETDGRHARIEYAERIEDDAARRDFTVNALYARPDGTVLDPLGGGLTDLAARKIRFVGDAAARITEDRLRILRFFRFHAWYGDAARGLDPAGLAACAAQADRVDDLSRERIGAEMRKLLAAPDPAPALAAMAQIGVLDRILPGATPDAIGLLVGLEREAAAVCAGDWLARLLALGAPADSGARLRLSRAETKRFRRIRNEIFGNRNVAELGYRLGAADAAAVVLVRAARGLAPLPAGWSEAAARGAAARIPIAAADLQPAFSGPALGAKLAELEARWIAADFALGRDELLAMARDGSA